jgi:translocation and assembly module TamB
LPVVGLNVEPFDWKGSDRDILVAGTIAWPEQGEVHLHAEGVAERDFVDFIEYDARGITISELTLNANWNQGPLRFELDLSGGLPARDSERPPEAAQDSRGPLSIRANVRGDASGLTFQPVEIISQIAPVLRVEGTAPFVFVPANRTNRFYLDEDSPFGLRASMARTEQASYRLGTKGKVVLQHPNLDMAIRGIAAKAEGHIHFIADSAAWRSATNEIELVKLDDLTLDAVVHRDRLILENFEVALDGQAMRAKAEWPIERRTWSDLVKKGRLPDWRTATARIEIADAAIAPLTKFGPKVLRPEGRFAVDLSILPGLKLGGYLTITNAATRALATLTPIRDIGARIEFTNREARIESFQGILGGQPVQLNGRAWLSDEAEPLFAADLQGRNVTLVRKAGLLLRGDVDVRLAREQSGSPKLSGRVNLRDGLFLMPVASLIPGQVSVQKPGPAAFGITNEPFADWAVDVQITGEEFLRARTPLFTATLSVDTRLQGRLAAPDAIGDVRINSGRIRFPFGTLVVDQGYLNLIGDATASELFVTASGRNYNYDVRLEVRGRLEEPAVTFSSAPPLSSEQILLMLSAGEIPNDEYVFSTRAKMGQFATFVGKDLLSRWRGDDDSEDRLTIRSGEDISEEGRTTYSVEYQISDRWSVVGEYDRFSAFNAGVKWRIISR